MVYVGGSVVCGPTLMLLINPTPPSPAQPPPLRKEGVDDTAPSLDRVPPELWKATRVATTAQQLVVARGPCTLR